MPVRRKKAKNNYKKLILGSIWKVDKFMLWMSLAMIVAEIFLFPQIAFMTTIDAENIIMETNQVRQEHNLAPLTANQILAKAAEEKAKAIFSSQKFQHNIGSRRFSAWVRDAGYEYSFVGENLAIDFATSESIIEAWKESPLHFRNLISPYYQEIGVAVMDGIFEGHPTTLVVQVFGTPPAAANLPAASPISHLSAGAGTQENSNLYSLEYDYRVKAENLMTNPTPVRSWNAVPGQKPSHLETLPAESPSSESAWSKLIEAARNRFSAYNIYISSYAVLIAILTLTYVYSSLLSEPATPQKA